MALIVSFLIDSFHNPLPWTDCRPEWPNCVAAGNRTHRTGALVSYHNTNRYLMDDGNVTLFAAKTGSSEYYFV